MVRYLVKKRGRTIDYVSIPKGIRLKKTSKGYSIKGGIAHKGYRLIESTSLRNAIKKITHRR